MQNVVLPAYIYHRTGRASFVGLFIFAQLGPMLLFSIPGGVFADRFDRRKWLIFAQGVQLSFSLLLFPLVARDAAIWMIFFAQLKSSSLHWELIMKFAVTRCRNLN